MAVLAGLDALKESCKVTVYTDSQYVCDAMSKGWLRRWQKKGWMRKKAQPVANSDLWQKMLALCEKHDVEFEWVKGHSGISDNERVDFLSYRALERGNLAIDEGFESRSEREDALRSAAQDNGRKTDRAPDRQGRQKITYEGQPCRKCSTPVIRRTPKRKRRRRKPARYWSVSSSNGPKRSAPPYSSAPVSSGSFSTSARRLIWRPYARRGKG